MLNGRGGHPSVKGFERRDCHVRFVPISDLLGLCRHLTVDSRDAGTSPGGRENADALLESPIKRGLGVIPHERCDLRNTISMAFKVLCRDLETPTAEILHRWHPSQRRKTFGERRAGQSDLARQRIQCPAVGGPSMHQGQRHADVTVAQA